MHMMYGNRVADIFQTVLTRTFVAFNGKYASLTPASPAIGFRTTKPPYRFLSLKSSGLCKTLTGAKAYSRLLLLTLADLPRLEVERLCTMFADKLNRLFPCWVGRTPHFFRGKGVSGPQSFPKRITGNIWSAQWRTSVSQGPRTSAGAGTETRIRSILGNVKCRAAFFALLVHSTTALYGCMYLPTRPAAKTALILGGAKWLLAGFALLEHWLRLPRIVAREVAVRLTFDNAAFPGVVMRNICYLPATTMAVAIRYIIGHAALLPERRAAGRLHRRGRYVHSFNYSPFAGLFKEPDYMKTARARISAASPEQPSNPKPPKPARKKPSEDQLNLFGEEAI
jgi:hypothetical protein